MINNDYANRNSTSGNVNEMISNKYGQKRLIKFFLLECTEDFVKRTV